MIPASDDGLVTERLLLRRLEAEDAPAIARLAGDERVARYTAAIPHPYPEGAAEAFIAQTREREAAGTTRVFAICLKREPEALIGAIEMRDAGDGSVEIGYWLGVPWWGQGLMSEAVADVARYAARWRPGATIGAHTFPDNAASQRVLEKAGFVRRGTGVRAAPARGCCRIEDAPVFVFPADAAEAGR